MLPDMTGREQPRANSDNRNVHEHKKAYHPTRRDEEAVNPDGSRLRAA